MNTPELFYCYDEGMMKYLQKQRHTYITKAYHYKTGRLFVLYFLTDELQSSIDKWNEAMSILK